MYLIILEISLNNNLNNNRLVICLSIMHLCNLTNNNKNNNSQKLIMLLCMIWLLCKALKGQINSSNRHKISIITTIKVLHSSSSNNHRNNSIILCINQMLIINNNYNNLMLINFSHSKILTLQLTILLMMIITHLNDLFV